MKTLEVCSLNEGVDSTLQEIDNIQTKITEMQKGIRGIIDLEYYLKGKTGEAIRSFYETVHEPFLIFLYESLIDYGEVLQTLKNDVHSYKADENGLVRQDFMENDVQRGLDKVETVASGIADEANKVMDNISDIVSLPPLDLEEFSHMVQKGRDKVNLHIEQLHELDHKQTKALNEVESDLDVMKSYMSEMTRTFHRDHSISSFNALTALELTTLPTIMKEVYGDPVTEEKEEKEEDEDNFLVKGLKVAGSTAKGVGTGVYDVGEETVVGVYNTVAHPIQTGAAMWDAVSHPIDTSKYIGNAIAESYERDMVNGDAESRSHWVTYTLGMTATSIFGTKGAGTVTKAGTTTAKTGAAAAKTTVANASKKVSELDMSNLFPFGPQYQVANGGYVPFNVVDGKQLKDQLIWQAEKLDGKGIGVSGNGKIPSVRNNEFNKWFDNISAKELEEMWNNPQLRSKIEDRIRRPGGYHEWHLVARTPKFKQWGISMDVIKEMRSLTKDVEFVNPPGRHGRRGSTKAHNEILKIIDSASDYESFVKGLNDWAENRMKNGIMDLPEGLRR